VSGELFLAEHRDWLAAQLDHCTIDALVPLRNGETTALPLRGAWLPLQWTTGRYARLHRDGETLVFAAPATAGDAALRRALRDFYASEARVDLGRWLPRQLPSLPRPPRRVQFKVMSSQWGSLAPDGSVALDLSLVLARPSAFEYVLVHELCHLIRADHSRAFWREVESRFPSWRDERGYFHAEGRRLKATLRALLG
jgi:predicted metal-dependent hydrolase